MASISSCASLPLALAVGPVLSRLWSEARLGRRALRDSAGFVTRPSNSSIAIVKRLTRYPRPWPIDPHGGPPEPVPEVLDTFSHATSSRSASGGTRLRGATETSGHRLRPGADDCRRASRRSSVPAQAPSSVERTDVDRDPRAPPQALSGTARRPGVADGRRRGDRRPREASRRRPPPSGGRRPVEPGAAPAAAAPSDGPSLQPDGGPATAARSALRRRGEGPRRDPVVGHARRGPAASLGAALRVGPQAVGAGQWAAPRRGQARVRHVRSCHGSTGGGGVGRQFGNGEVLKTFPKFEDQASLVYTGSAPYRARSTATRTGRADRTRTAGSTAGSCRNRGPSTGGPSPTRRSSPSCATSGTRSAAPTRPTRSTCRRSPTGARREAPKFEAVSAGEKTLDEEGISTTPKA